MRPKAIMIVSGETEAGYAGKQPCRGIAWWAHRDDDRSAEAALLRSSQNHIGSVDPHALKIPARRAEFYSLRRVLALHFTLNRDKWYAAKTTPKKYGERLAQEISGSEGAPLVPAIINIHPVEAGKPPGE